MNERHQAALQPPCRLGLILLVVALGTPSRDLRADTGDPLRAGAKTYAERCARCHGAQGGGVETGYPRPLAGEKSVLQLARYIAKYMPEDAPGTCTGDEAEQVARYIHESFYSPIAAARNRPVRIEPARLTVKQHRNALADVIGSFRRSSKPDGAEREGLRASYYNSERPGRRSVLERNDAQVRFDFGRENPDPEKLGDQGFAARWEGALLAPETGSYEILVRTDHAARLWVNDRDRPLIDAWVKSGSDTEYRASLFLLGGYSYPLKLEFSSRKQGVADNEKKKKEKPPPVAAFVELWWRLPKRAPEPIPPACLSPWNPAEVFVADTPFPPDDRSVGFERGSAVSAEWDESATGAAIAAATHVAEHLEELSGVKKGAPDREARLRDFCLRFASRAFRRPLGDDERRIYVDRHVSGAADLEGAVKRVVLLVLKSPRFLHVEIPGRKPDAHTVAGRLALALWDSLPDEALLEAAASGGLASREEVLRQAERMLGDLRARSKLRGFLHHWLDVEHTSEIVKDEKAFPGFTPAISSDLRASLDLFLEDIVWGEEPDFRRLLLSRELYLNGRLGGFYGVELPPEAPFAKVESREAERAGILSHPYILARFSYQDTTSPIHRGVFLTRNLLGRTLRPPPEAFTPLAPDLHPDLTTRERVSLQTEPEACQPCHRMINPLGFTLESFDAAGRYRLEERGKPIDATGLYEPLSGEARRFQGVRDLAEFLAGSEEAHQAFVTQLFRHLVKQPPLAYGPEVPAKLRQSFAASGFHIRKLAAEIAAEAALTGLVPVAAPSKAPLEKPPAPPYAEPGRNRKARL
jgi:hypothetical protein